jgi:hypothetical protein
MTDKEIKTMLKNAYVAPETEKGKKFVRKYGQRSLQLSSIIKMEFRYMGLKSILTGAVLVALLLMAAGTENTDMVWVIASFAPACVLTPMVLLSRSERFGMEELEAASRFSLRFIRIVRMFILGIFSLLLLLSVGIVLRITAAASVMEHMMLVVFPYLVSAYGAMLVTRKWHGKENIFGVLAVCIFGGLLPYAERSIRLSGRPTNAVILLLTAMILGAMFRECRLYVKESENLSWNLS